MTHTLICNLTQQSIATREPITLFKGRPEAMHLSFININFS